MAREEVILPFPVPRAQIEHATHYRSTWVVSSLQSLRAAGLFDRYVALLPTTMKSEILDAVAGVWMPMPIARAHYVACDELGLTTDEQLALGASVGERAQGNVLSNVVRAARGAGVTPWTIFPQFQRLWARGANGGSVAVFRLGPKDARAEFMGCELFDVAYFRHAFRGVVLGILSLFCRRAYAHEAQKRARGEVTFHMQWA
jgi:hypothetical protein